MVPFLLFACSALPPACTPVPPGEFCKATTTKSEHHRRQLAAANEWVHAAAQTIRNTQVDEVLLQQARVLSNFSGGLWPSEISSCPVFYPFCGVDLPTVQGLFPHASELFFVAGLPIGNFSCFLSEACKGAATISVLHYFKGWMGKANQMSFAGSGSMLRVFNAGSLNMSEWHSSGVGLLPTLLVTMHLLTVSQDGSRGSSNGSPRAPLIDDFAHHEFVREDKEDASSSVLKITWRNCTAQLSYLSTWVPIGATLELPHSRSTYEWVAAPRSEELVSALRKASHRVGLGERQRVTFLKAAEHMHEHMLIDNGVARWILDVSAATLHDETGLRPFVYGHDLITRRVQWEVYTYGEFRQFLGYAASPEEVSEWVEAVEGAPPLPFKFGYGSGVRTGPLMTAWRNSAVLLKKGTADDVNWHPWVAASPPPPPPSHRLHTITG